MRLPNLGNLEGPAEDLVHTIREWRRLIVTTAAGLPFLSAIIAVLITSAPDSGFGRFYISEVPQSFLVLDLNLVNALYWLLFAAICVPFNWPFYVLALRAKRNVTRRWPNARAANAAMTAGLIGLLIPYGWIYLLLTPAELATDGLGGGEATGYALGIGAPIVGGALAYIGLWIAPRIFRGHNSG